MKPLIEKLLEEVDADIKEIILSPLDGDSTNSMKIWQALVNPVQVILDWQKYRDSKK